MKAGANVAVLRRAEAEDMVKDLETAIHNVISLLDGASDMDKVRGADTLVLLQTKRNILEGEIASADRAAAREAGAS